MGYFYKRGNVWRLTFYKDHKRMDVGLGDEFGRAKILRSSIEQAVQEDRFKMNLSEVLHDYGLTQSTFQITKVEEEKKPPTWDESVNRVLEHLEKIGRRKRTLFLAKKALGSMKDIIKPSAPADVTDARVDQWIAELLSMPNSKDKTGEKKVSAAYVLVFIRSAKACFRWFLRWKLVSSNPFTGCEMPKVEKNLPKPFTEEDLEKLLNACNKPLRRCIEILSYSGMRPDEFIHLTWNKVTLGDRPSINIKASDVWKPKAKIERIIPCSQELVDALGNLGLSDELVAGMNEHGNSVTMNWLERSFRRAVRRAGLQDKKYTLYCCRDTYATNLALQGYEAHAIAARLGHTSIQTSMHYVSLARVSTEATAVKKGKRM